MPKIVEASLELLNPQRFFSATLNLSLMKKSGYFMSKYLYNMNIISFHTYLAL